MTQAQKLQKLIERAIENDMAIPRVLLITSPISGKLTDQQKQLLIRLPRFTKALFGEDPTYPRDDGKKDDLKCFEYHLQQAVISDNPVDYYYNEVFGKETSNEEN